MSEKYPLLLKPVIKDYIWGGTRLKEEFGFETDKAIAAEGWMLACHKDGTNTVLNGALSGKSFSEALSLFGHEGEFPLLIKLIDARDRLSVQVHPDNNYAFEKEGEPGKTEMWYIVDCEPDAKLIYGFKKEIGKEEFERRIRDNTLEEVMNSVPVKKGDVFFISAGTLHAIGKGILIAEIQQNSNTTYRVSDYGRLGADGKPRELHIEKALDVTVTDKPSVPYGNVGEIREFDYGCERALAECEFFKVHLLKLNGKVTLPDSDSFISLLILDGQAEIQFKDQTLSLTKGDSVYIPENCPVSIVGTAEIICSKK